MWRKPCFVSKKLAFDFCRFSVAIPFFIPATTANDLQLWRISIPDFIHYIFCPIFILQKEPVFPFLMLSAKQGNYWYHFYNVFGMTQSLTGDWINLFCPTGYSCRIYETLTFWYSKHCIKRRSDYWKKHNETRHSLKVEVKISCVSFLSEK